MARVFLYTSILAGVLILLWFLGFPTASSMLLNHIGFTNGNLTSFTSSQMYTTIVAIFGIMAIVGIVAGLITRTTTESFIVGTMAGLLFTWISADLLSLIVLANGTCPIGSQCDFVTKLIAMIIMPVYVGWCISIVQWWRGNDI